jgi:hypothetical protein
MSRQTEALRIVVERKRCPWCKTRFPEGLLFPVDTVRPGVLQPNINPEFTAHAKDTHGYPAEVVRQMLIHAVYGGAHAD